MTTLLIAHPACLAHDMGEGHPERPDRLRAVERALESEMFQMLARDVAPRAEIEAIARVHPRRLYRGAALGFADAGADRDRSGHVDVSRHL